MFELHKKYRKSNEIADFYKLSVTFIDIGMKIADIDIDTLKGNVVNIDIDTEKSYRIQYPILFYPLLKGSAIKSY